MSIRSRTGRLRATPKTASGRLLIGHVFGRPSIVTDEIARRSPLLIPPEERDSQEFRGFARGGRVDVHSGVSIAPWEECFAAVRARRYCLFLVRGCGQIHSDFRVAAGSARIARMAGAMDAIIAIVPRIASATTNVTGSIGFTPKSRLAIVRSRAADALTP